MRELGLVVLASAALASPWTAHGGSPGATALRVTYWENGKATAPTATWSLRCNPTRGTLPRPARACARLAAGGAALFAPVPPGSACTQIYGGPQTARVVGVVGGRRIWVRLSRTDGCQIARWNRLAPWLVPPGGVTS